MNNNDKYVLIQNNFPSNVPKLSIKVNKDFSKIIDNLTINPSFLEFDNNKFITHLNEDQLEILKNETQSNYILLIQTLLKPDISNRKIFKSINRIREYRVILRLINVESKEVLYYKESISNIKIPSDQSSISKSEKSQLIKTYDILYNDFKQEFIKTTP